MDKVGVTNTDVSCWVFLTVETECCSYGRNMEHATDAMQQNIISALSGLFREGAPRNQPAPALFSLAEYQPEHCKERRPSVKFSFPCCE